MYKRFREGMLLMLAAILLLTAALPAQAADAADPATAADTATAVNTATAADTATAINTVTAADNSKTANSADTVQNGWNKSKTIYYQNGVPYTGQKKIGGKQYLFQKGKMKKGFREIVYKGKTITVYYSKKTGEKLFGNQKIKGNWYYFEKPSGKMKTGWLKKGGKRYFYDSEGHKNTYEHITKKAAYFFDEKTGALKKKITRKQSKKAAGKKDKKALKTYMLMGLSEAEIVEKVGPLCTEDQKKTGILASVTMAQFMLESWTGRSELALMANNCFGIKKFVSAANGGYWDGVSYYRKQTGEEDANGNRYTITADFRKYSSIQKSISDHSDYLLYARNGSKLRYAGIKGCKSYKKALRIIKNGGYATSSDYVTACVALIKKWKLTRFDVK